jgi:hypothetical protein
MLKVTEYNYDHYKKIFSIIWDYIRPLMPPGAAHPDNHPVDVLERWEKLNKSRAIKGLQIGMIDTIAMWRDASEKQKEEVNLLLLQQDLPSIYNILTIGQNVHAQVLKRNKIRNIDEYYIIVELLSAVDAPISAEEREKLNGIVAAFEAKKRK